MQRRRVQPVRHLLLRLPRAVLVHVAGHNFEQSRFLGSLLVGALATSCTSYDYSGRSRSVSLLHQMLGSAQICLAPEEYDDETLEALIGAIHPRQARTIRSIYNKEPRKKKNRRTRNQTCPFRSRKR